MKERIVDLLAVWWQADVATTLLVQTTVAAVSPVTPQRISVNKKMAGGVVCYGVVSALRGLKAQTSGARRESGSRSCETGRASTRQLVWPPHCHTFYVTPLTHTYTLFFFFTHQHDNLFNIHTGELRYEHRACDKWRANMCVLKIHTCLWISKKICTLLLCFLVVCLCVCICMILGIYVCVSVHAHVCVNACARVSVWFGECVCARVHLSVYVRVCPYTLKVIFLR